jgi:hypothetical protein
MRALVADRLRARWPGARIIHELSLRYSERRLDMAAVTDREIVGVEIKSSRDVAGRLEAQLRGFSPVTTRLIVALAPCWNVDLPPEQVDVRRKGQVIRTVLRPRRTEAQAAIQSSGVWPLETWTVSAETGEVDCTGGGASHFDTAWPWPSRLLNLLHVAELEAILARHPAPCRSKTHGALVAALLHQLTTPAALREVCRALRARDAFDRESDPPIRDERREAARA